MQTCNTQLSFTDVFQNVEQYFVQDKPKLIKLFEQYINITSLIPHASQFSRFKMDFEKDSLILPGFRNQLFNLVLVIHL